MNGYCEHPRRERWQYPLTWFCCLCGRYFWGNVDETPASDVYGRPA